LVLKPNFQEGVLVLPPPHCGRPWWQVTAMSFDSSPNKP